MSLLAGFDYVEEISNETITKLFKSNVEIGGVLMNPPFELTLPGGTAHLVVDDLQIDLEGDDSMTITFAFSRSAILLPPVQTVLGSSRPVLAPLDGTIKVNLLLKLVSGRDDVRDVRSDMGSAAVRVTYSGAAERVIVSGLAQADIPVELFKNGVVDAITTMVRNVPNITFPFGYVVKTGTDGKIEPNFQFSNLQMRCVGHRDRSRQALTLLGNFFAATEHNGNRLEKTETGILPGQDFARTFSSRAVHSLFFCPTVAKAQPRRNGNEVTVAELPTSCGSAHHLPLDDVNLTALLDGYIDGAIQVSGSIQKSGTCYEASGTFNARMILAVTPGGSVTYKVTVDEPEVDVSIDLWCALAVVGLLGYFSLVAVAYVEAVAAQIAASASKSILDNLLSDNSPAGQLTPSGVKLSSVSITPLGMTLQGQIDIPVPFVDSTKFVSIIAVSKTKELTAGGQGQWTTKISCQETAKTYTYTETQQRQTPTFDLKAQLVATPLSVTYFVRGAVRGIGDIPAPSGPPIQLKDSRFGGVMVGDASRTVTVPNVECMYPLPLGTAGTKVTQDVHLDYLITGTQIQITNRVPAEGNFFILLEAAVLDATGTAPAGVDARPAMWILFEGNSVAMDNEYLADQEECALKSVQRIPRNYLPAWKFEFDPSPAWRTFAQIRALKEMEFREELRKGEVEKLFLEAQVAHGDTITQAYRASADVSKGDLTVAAQESITLNATGTELRSQLGILNHRLAQVEREERDVRRRVNNEFGRIMPH